MSFLELILAILALGIIFYKWATSTYKEFEKRGLPYEKPFPLVGNLLAMVMGKVSNHKLMGEFFKRNSHHKLVGFFNFRAPVVQINDPALIKTICIKDFDYFPNHPTFFITNERLIDDMLTIMKDQRWKHMRVTLTPIFTSAKMRQMFSLMNDSFDECMEHLDKLGKISKSGKGFEVELKEVCNRLSNDLIATTAFGLKVSSYEEPNNRFFRIGQSVVTFRGKQLYKFMVSATMPKLSRLLGYKIFDVNNTNYFIDLVVNAMKYREENNIVRPDMIQLLMEAKKESSKNWTDDEIVAQCFIFFFAAFKKNNASFICLVTHELLHNPEVQEKLYEEVLETKESLEGGSLTYDAVQKMKYMDMVISETLRKWPLVVTTDRQCVKDYTLRDEDGSKMFDFKVGDRVNIPIGGLHWDERYFPKPMKFDPERFSDEQKNNIVPYTYLPFGLGPRNCIDNRYALMQAKAVLYHLILKYKMERSPKTAKNLMDDSRGFQLTPLDGHWVYLVPRK